jgi:hypothetical protein
MEIRSPLLNSATHRNNLRPGAASRSEIAQTLTAIDRMGQLYDTLRAVNEAVNPEETPTARAMRYEKQFNNAVKKARDTALEAAGRLDFYAQTLETRALEVAGLASQPANASEIRSALRAMPEKDRDEAIKDAFDRKDASILSAIFRQTPLLWGGSKLPLDEAFKLYVREAAPDVVEEMESVSKVTEGLNLATDTFLKSAEKWRDPLTAAKGFQQAQEFEAAEAALKAALG